MKNLFVQKRCSKLLVKLTPWRKFYHLTSSICTDILSIENYKCKLQEDKSFKNSFVQKRCSKTVDEIDILTEISIWEHFVETNNKLERKQNNSSFLMIVCKAYSRSYFASNWRLRRSSMPKQFRTHILGVNPIKLKVL